MKIACLSSSYADIAQELGLSLADIVAVTNDHPEKSLPHAVRIGSPKALDFTPLETLKPDLIIAREGENRPEDLKNLKRKFKVLSFDVRSIQNVIDVIHTLGDALGRREGAETLKHAIKQTLRKNQEELRNREPLPILILLWNNPFLTVNFDTYISRLLEACGGSNVFHSDPVPEFAIEIEDMIEREPRLLLLPKMPYPFARRHIEGFRKYRVFSKIRIELIDGRYFSKFGPWTVKALQDLPLLLAGQSDERP